MRPQHMTLALSLILIVLAVQAACAGGTTPAPVTTSSPATATSPPATAASVPATATSVPATVAPVPEATPTLTGEQVTFQFVTPLATIEEIDDIDLLLQGVEGILDVTGNENSITIIYDPAVITEDALRQKMAEIRHPVQAP